MVAGGETKTKHSKQAENRPKPGSEESDEERSAEEEVGYFFLIRFSYYF
jgi:hypothetical protein